ncbi:hypothetical protein ACTG16_23330 [Aeromonas sp. 23P]|uniref:hypothetical protein n=1 Tax=Aeromonas sp. 23P TaxID=3452716 RepID=UPI003F7A23CB
MNNLEKLQQLQLWLEDNVDQGHAALVYENADDVTLTQTDCAQALGDVLGINDGIDLYAKTIVNLTLEMANLPAPAQVNKARVLSNMARTVAKITEQMYQIDNEISDQLGQSITSVTDMFNDLANVQALPVNTLVKLKASVKQTHCCPEGREDNSTAEVLAVLGEGRLHLSRDLHGCRWWNINDVELA